MSHNPVFLVQFVCYFVVELEFVVVVVIVVFELVLTFVRLLF